MGQLERDFLLQALESPLGIELESANPDRDFMRLSQERTKDKTFERLTIRRGGAGREQVIWIVKLPARSASAIAEEFVNGRAEE